MVARIGFFGRMAYDTNCSQNENEPSKGQWLAGKVCHIRRQPIRPRAVNPFHGKGTGKAGLSRYSHATFEHRALSHYVRDATGRAYGNSGVCLFSQ